MFARDADPIRIGVLVAIRNFDVIDFARVSKDSNNGMLRLGIGGSMLEVRGWKGTGGANVVGGAVLLRARIE